MTTSRSHRRIVCTIICVDDEPSDPTRARFEQPVVDRLSELGSRLEAPRGRLGARPSELLPWADPYISKLVRRLQDEVRRERGGRPAPAERAELDPPSPLHDFEADRDDWDEPRWSRGGNLN